MKQTIVRLSVLAIALTGFAASTLASHSQKNAKQVAMMGQQGPVALCPYNDPNYCGMH